MIQLPENFDSIFRYIVVVSQRAEQLINGARPRAEGRHTKPTLTAKNDVDAGEVNWRILTQEELDAQRQAIVDQFRAEVSGDGEGAEAEGPIPDVLPTAAGAPEVEAPVVEGEERDDELDRLQRLLGIARGGAAVADEEEKVVAEDADVDAEDEEVEEISLEDADLSFEKEGDDDEEED